MVKLTDKGSRIVSHFIKECNAKRKEILDAGKDTAKETQIPTIDDILCDIEQWEDGDEYYNAWGVTDHYDSGILGLKNGEDYVYEEGKR